MRLLRPSFLLAAVAAVAACAGPTQQDIENDLERELQSVTGPWVANSPPLTLDFELQAGAGTAVSGTGFMKEAAAPTTVPITVTGTFQRPVLSLTITGMTFEGRAVQATFQGSYTTVGGISGPLHLTGSAYSRDITILLQER